MNEKTYTVSEINSLINRKLKMDPNFKNILVKGEISNFKTNAFSGHSYFTLKDENSQIDAVMFKGMKDRFLEFEPEDGMKVIIKGKIDILLMLPNKIIHRYLSRIINIIYFFHIVKL